MKANTLLHPLPVRHKNDPCCAPVAAPSLTLTQTDTLADRLKALGDPTRLRMLDLLAQQAEPLCVCDLTPQFSQNQPTISHHLKLLREAGLIDSTKQGIWAYYRATEEGRRSLAAVKTLTYSVSDKESESTGGVDAHRTSRLSETLSESL